MSTSQIPQFRQLAGLKTSSSPVEKKYLGFKDEPSVTPGIPWLTKYALDYVFVFAYYGITVSIQRALFAGIGGTSYYDVERETILFRDLFNTFEDFLCQEGLVDLWLSYCESNVAIIGSFMVTALLPSTDDKIYQVREGALEEFRRLILRSDRHFEFAALPLLRPNLLVERFTDGRASPKQISNCR